MEDGLFPIISDENQSIPYLSMKPIKLLLLCIRKNVDASTQEILSELIVIIFRYNAITV